MPRTRRSIWNCSRQPLALRGELIEQHAADGAGPDHADRDRVRREIEARSAPSAAPASLACAVDDDRDVALGCALRDRADVDAGAPSALNTLPAMPGVPAMPSPTTARMPQPRSTSTFWICPPASSRVESARARTRSARSACACGNREADRMLRAPLRNQDDRDAILAQRAEQALRRARHADHAGALEVDERDAVDAGDALHRQ